MKRILMVFSYCLLLVSCSNDKSYSYVEVTEDKGIGGGPKVIKDNEKKSISALNDSIAYFKAFELFCISMKVQKEMVAANYPTFSTPIKFKLLDSKNEDISLVEWKNKSVNQDSIKKKILSMPSNITASNKAVSEQEPISKFDTLKVNALKKYFRVSKDEFSTNERKTYEPTNAPKFVNVNGIYCYFSVVDNKPLGLRFRVQYYAEDWLFFQSLKFSIDGKAFEFVPQRVETDNEGGHIWEWFDEVLTPSDKALIMALSTAKDAKIRFEGRQYYKVKTVSKEQINSIKRTLELYEAMGGEL